MHQGSRLSVGGDVGSLDGYVKMKTVMKFDGKTFRPVALSEYAENDDMKEALKFVEGTAKSSGYSCASCPIRLWTHRPAYRSGTGVVETRWVRGCAPFEP